MRKIFLSLLVVLILSGCELRDTASTDDASTPAEQSTENVSKTDSTTTEKSAENLSDIPAEEQGIYGFKALWGKYFPTSNTLNRATFFTDLDTPKIMFQAHSKFLYHWEFWLGKSWEEGDLGVMKTSSSHDESYEETFKTLLAELEDTKTNWENVNKSVYKVCEVQGSDVPCKQP